MEKNNKENINEYLISTEYCDINHPKISELARKITKRYKEPRDKAVALFYWVRDEVPYKFGSWQKKASRVLREGYGMCTNKALLLTALFRSCGIPAGFGIIKVKGKEYFGPIGPRFLTQKVSDKTVHIYSYVYINNKWLKVDPTVDKDISIKTSYFNFTTRIEDWDGTKDGMHHISPAHIIEDIGPLVSIDYKLDKKPKRAKGIFLIIINLYLDFLRQNRKKVNDSRHIEELFVGWLKRKRGHYYMLYFLIHNIFHRKIFFR